MPALAGLLLLGVAALLFAVVACSGDDDDAPEVTPTASPSPAPGTPTPTEARSPTPPPSPTATPPEALRAFADFGGRISEALRDESTAFFLTSPALSEMECPNELMDQCGPGPTPTVLSGVLVGAWRSEAFPRTLNDFGIEVGEYLAKGPTLKALAVDETDTETIFYAVTAVDSDPQSTAVFAYKVDSAVFMIFALIYAPTLGEEWLSGDCTECYDTWMAWEGP